MDLLARSLIAVAVAAAIAAPTPSFAQRVAREGDAIVFEGRIDSRSAEAFLELLGKEPGVTRLVITSGGGLVGPALDMAEAIAAHGLDIEVPTNCRSSCANYLFPAARHKRIGSVGAVAWHGNMTHVLHMARTGQEQYGEQAMRSARELAAREAALFRRLGVDGFVCWFGKLAPYAVEDFYALAPGTMRWFGIRNVTLDDVAAPLPADVVLLVPRAEQVEAIRPAEAALP